MSVDPNLFLIGGMKCGSTTLYDDLSRHPDVYAPPSKEPGFLKFTDLSEIEIKNKYRNLFQKGGKIRYRIDGTTQYSMRTELQNVPDRLKNMFGGDIRIIYTVRNPIDRIQSHYRHLVSTGRCNCSLNELIDRDPRLVDNSRYAWQLEPWLHAFGSENIFVLNFEAFIMDRRASLERAFDFLGLETPKKYVLEEVAKNTSDGKVIPKTWISPITNNFFIKTKIEPLLPKWIPMAMKKVTHRPAPVVSFEMSEDIQKRIVELLKSDVRRISDLCNYPTMKNGDVLWSDFL